MQFSPKHSNMPDIHSTERIFYLHIPKTAGSTINKIFLSNHDEDEALTHIESKNIFDGKECNSGPNIYRYLSGHIKYPFLRNNLDLKDWTTICTFRKPDEHLASHISWVRLLGEPGHENRLKQHGENIQEIVNHIKNVDLSSPSQIRDLISWLEDNNQYLFHNTQTRYLWGQGHP